MKRTSLILLGAVCIAMLLPAGADAAVAGHAGYSGSLSSNAAIRKQQLICDPTDPTVGSTSTIYDAGRTDLTRIDPWVNNPTDGYVITRALIEVREEIVVDLTEPPRAGEFVTHLVPVPVGQDFLIPNQTGYVQVRYQGVTGTGPPLTGVSGAPQGYEFRDYKGEVGQNTHALLFLVHSDVPLDEPLVYTNYADAGGKPIKNSQEVSQPDTLMNAMGMVVGPGTPTPITSATVSGPLIPEPASIGLLAAGAAAALLVRRRPARQAKK